MTTENCGKLKPDRREFFGSLGSGAIALGATASLRAANQALEPVRMAVIGTGARGSDLIRALTTIDGVEIVGVCDDYPPHLAQGLKYAGERAQEFSDYRKMLEVVKPQAAIVAVPIVLHAQVCGEAISAGCDVFCEKTMCYTVAEARKLATQVAAAKCVFQVGLQRRANPVYQQAVAMVEAGLIGQITAIKAQWHRNNNWRRPLPVAKSDPDWQRLERKLNWRLYRETSAGLMAELGSHQMDVANWLLGVTPQRVLASGGIDYWRDGRDVPDNIFCVYEYELPAGPLRRDKLATGAGGDGEAKAMDATPPRIVRVTYSALCNNAYEGAAELVLGTHGSLYLTQNKGLLYREAVAEKIDWAAGGNAGQRADVNAAVVAAGKTLKLASDPWAHRGKPIEIDNESGNDTRDQLVSFLEHVRTRDAHTLVDAQAGLVNAATVLIANEALEKSGQSAFPAV